MDTFRKDTASRTAARTGLLAHTPPSTKLEPTWAGKGEAAKYVGAAEVANATFRYTAIHIEELGDAKELHGDAKNAGSVRRVRATEIEMLVVNSVREHLKLAVPPADSDLMAEHVARVEVQPDRLVIRLAAVSNTKAARKRPKARRILEVPWRKTPSRKRREILLPAGVPQPHARPIRSETRATLVASIARGRRWLDELTTDATASVESIATRERCSARKVTMTMSLAFLAPDLVKAAIEGTLPHGMGVTRLADLPAEWSRQHQMLDLAVQ